MSILERKRALGQINKNELKGLREEDLTEEEYLEEVKK